MHVQVLSYRSTRGPPQVKAGVDGIGAGNPLQDPDGGLRELKELAGLLLGKVFQLRFLAVRDDHHVAGVIGIKVEHTIDKLTAGNDEPVLVRHLRDLHKWVTGFLWHVTGAALTLDVAHAVRRPQAL